MTDPMPVAEILPGIPLDLAADLMRAVDQVLTEHGYDSVVQNSRAGYRIVARRKT